MSSVRTPPFAGPSASAGAPPRSVPSLDELYAWTAEPDHRVVIRGVGWPFYEQVVDSIPEGANLHVDYDGKDLEIMSVSPIHDVVKKTLARFVEFTADELDVPCTGLGQTTWKRPEVVRGLEADDCYYFTAEKLAVADQAILRWSKDVAEYPNPDLAIEVDVSPSQIDRQAIDASLRVAEVWRFDGERQRIVIERLSGNGTYQTVDVSEFLPVRSDEIGRWVLEEDRSAGSRWGQRLRAWVRDEVAPRLHR
jgi:Uma2 family endonuclease